MKKLLLPIFFMSIFFTGYSQTTNEKSDDFLDLNKPERLEDTGHGKIPMNHFH